MYQAILRNLCSFDSLQVPTSSIEPQRASQSLIQPHLAYSCKGH